jgi:hypothetical protein
MPMRVNEFMRINDVFLYAVSLRNLANRVEPIRHDRESMKHAQLVRTTRANPFASQRSLTECPFGEGASKETASPSAKC